MGLCLTILHETEKESDETILFPTILENISLNFFQHLTIECLEEVLILLNDVVLLFHLVRTHKICWCNSLQTFIL